MASEKKFEVKKIMTIEEYKRKYVLGEIKNARVGKESSYTRGEAVAFVTRYIYRLYDYYGIYGEKTMSGFELAELLSNIAK